jgi:hypothetical protein
MDRVWKMQIGRQGGISRETPYASDLAKDGEIIKPDTARN